jgi:rRNA maturation endonuclease Nob1
MTRRKFLNWCKGCGAENKYRKDQCDNCGRSFIVKEEKMEK